MKVKIKMRVGLAAAIIAIVYYSMITIGMFILTCLMPKEKFVLAGLF